MLHRLLTLNGEVDVAETLKPNQPMDAIFFGEAIEHTFFVLPNATDDVGRNTKVQGATGF
jgi:hypothetical protein